MLRIRVPSGIRLGTTIVPVIIGIAACANAAAPIETSPASPAPTATTAPATTAPAGTSSPVPAAVPNVPIPNATPLSQLEAYATDFPQGLVAAFDSIWTTNENLDTVTRIDPTLTRVTAIHVGATGEPAVGPQRIAATGSSIWAAGGGGLVRIDPATDAVVTRVSGGFQDVQAAFGGVWAGEHGGVVRLDPDTGTILAEVNVGGQDMCTLSVAAGSIWLGCGQDLHRVDPATNAVSATIRGAGSSPVVIGDDRATWVLAGQDPFASASEGDAYSTIQRLDTAANRLVDGSAMRLVQGASAAGYLDDGASVWLSTTFGTGPGAGKLYRFDPAAGTVTAAFDVSEGKGYGANALGFAYGSLWLASGTANAVRRLPRPTP